jgi:ABC-type tungstate transport system permease subunit
VLYFVNERPYLFALYSLLNPRNANIPNLQKEKRVKELFKKKKGSKILFVANGDKSVAHRFFLEIQKTENRAFPSNPPAKDWTGNTASRAAADQPGGRREEQCIPTDR